MIQKFIAACLLLCITCSAFGQEQTSPHLDDELRILSWNIYALPFTIFHKSEKKDRARGIGDSLAIADYDVILFQEAFKKNVRRVLRKKLRDEYPYHYGPANQRRMSLKTNSGLYVFSRKPLIHLEEIKFDHCKGSSCLARKGAMLLEGEFEGRLYQVVVTHTNGAHQVNNSQFHQIYSHLLYPYYKDGVPQIIGGDMNCRLNREPEYSEMLSLLDAENGETKGFPYSNWEQTAVIDYILMRSNESGIKVNRRAILAIGGESNTAVKRPARESIGLSDHYAVEISLSWED